MKNKITILLIPFGLIIFLAFNSSDKTNNHIDDNSQRQGYWIYSELDTLINNIALFMTSDTIDGNINGIAKEPISDTIIYRNVSKTGYYLDNLLDSVWHFYESEKTIPYVKRNDTLYGNYKFIAHFKDNKLNGVLKTYNNGNLVSSFNFQNDKAEGEFECYFESGELKYKGIIDPDKNLCSLKEYSIKGYKIKENIFEKDIIIKQWTDLDELKNRIEDK